MRAQRGREAQVVGTAGQPVATRCARRLAADRALGQPRGRVAAARERDDGGAPPHRPMLPHRSITPPPGLLPPLPSLPFGLTGGVALPVPGGGRTYVAARFASSTFTVVSPLTSIFCSYE